MQMNGEKMIMSLERCLLCLVKYKWS